MLWALLIACTPEPEPDPCVPREALVTDIDETLTTLDSEWIAQILDAAHDPEERPDASTLMQGYAELGYTVIYVTARGDGTTLQDGRTGEEATADWLVAHGFPYEPGTLFLAEGIGALGDDAADYKIEVLEGLQADGWTFHLGYGNATTDIEAFRAVGIPDDRLFGVGELSDELGVVPIPDEDAYTAHLPVLDSTPSAPPCE